MMIRSALLVALLLMPAWLLAQAGDAPIGLFTIVEGEVTVLREAREFRAAEGVLLRAEDIVRSRETALLTRIELQDGTLLDLGPATELLLQPQALAATPAAPGASLYLLRGWLKLTATSDKASAGLALASPQIALASLSGSVIVRVAPQASLAFVEAGQANAFERSAAKPAMAYALNDGDSVVVRSGTSAAVVRRPPPDLIDGLPRAFTDTLPRRAAQWRGRTVAEPAPLAGPGYADLVPWLHADPALRAAFVKRFSPLLRDRSFRSSLLAELPAHPEWGRVLFPEKYHARTASTVVARRPTAPQVPAYRPSAAPRTANGMLAPPPAPAATLRPTADAAIAQAPRTETTP
jgi:hypothetical protein